MHNMDCTDIKVLLSGLIDDEIDEQTRYLAERHIAECKSCRDLLDEAEALNQTVAVEAQEHLAPDDLPRGFIGTVLSRTAYDEQRSGTRFAGWMNWLGWVAAAASLLLAITIWAIDHRLIPSRSQGQPHISIAPPAPQHPDARQASYVTAARSWTYSGTMPTEESGPPVVESLQLRQITIDNGIPIDLYIESNTTAAPPDREIEAPAVAVAPSLTTGPLISREDAETMDAAALLLNMLLASGDRSFSDIEQIRRIAVYDELLSRLAEARGHLDANDRPTLFAAESVLLRIINGPVSSKDVQELRDMVRQSGLPAQLRSISARYNTGEPL